MSGTAVDDYLSGFSGEIRERLDAIRATLHEALPGAVEKVAYGVAALTLRGKSVVYFGGFSGHVSVYPVPADPDFEAEAAPYRAGKGTLKFPLGTDVPLGLVARQARLLAAARGLD